MNTDCIHVPYCPCRQILGQGKKFTAEELAMKIGKNGIVKSNNLISIKL